MKKRPTDPTKIIDEIQVSLSETKTELRLYSVLFLSLGEASLQAEDLKGLNITFNRLIALIDETNRQLNKIYSTY